MEFIFLLAVATVLAWRFKPVEGIRSISAAELKSMLQDRDKTFIDVRTPGEYGGRYIKQFKNVPLCSDFSNFPVERKSLSYAKAVCEAVKRANS